MVTAVSLQTQRAEVGGGSVVGGQREAALQELHDDTRASFGGSPCG